MIHTALLIHSLTQAHARPREDREAKHRQSEPTSEREREQHTTQHNDRYIVNTLTMQYSSMVWQGVGQGCGQVGSRAGRQSNSKREERASHRSGTPGTAHNKSNVGILFLFWYQHRQRPQSPKDNPSHYCQTIQRRRCQTARIPQRTALTQGEQDC